MINIFQYYYFLRNVSFDTSTLLYTNYILHLRLNYKILSLSHNSIYISLFSKIKYPKITKIKL